MRSYDFYPHSECIDPECECTDVHNDTLTHDTAYRMFGTAQETMNEVIRQAVKWGEGRTLPDLSPPGTWTYAELEKWAKETTDRHANDGTITWSDILTEEVMEAYAAETDEDRIMELIQVAAVCWSWIDDLKRR